ncbi:hypothetical protein GUI12_01845 [Anaplasmataceae bacterium AB001_6]|nr:hypothetical protein GUI12_01845 [Anaplasmataceae bacterium AB001_6]
MKKILIIQCLGLLSQIQNSLRVYVNDVTNISYNAKKEASKTNINLHSMNAFPITAEMLADKISSLTEEDILKNIGPSAQKEYSFINNHDKTTAEKDKNLRLYPLEEQFAIERNVVTKNNNQPLDKSVPESLTSIFNRVILGNADILYEDKLKTPYDILKLTNHLFSQNANNLSYISDKIGDMGDYIIPKETIYDTASNIRETTYSAIESIPLLGSIIKDVTLKLEKKINDKLLKPYYDIDSFLAPPIFRINLETFSSYLVLKQLNMEYQQIKKLSNLDTIPADDAKKIESITKIISKHQKAVSNYIKHTIEYVKQIIPSYTESTKENSELAKTETNSMLDSTINTISTISDFIYTTLQTSLDDKNFEKLDEIILNSADLRAIDYDGILEELFCSFDNIFTESINNQDRVANEDPLLFSKDHDKYKSIDSSENSKNNIEQNARIAKDLNIRDISSKNIYELPDEKQINSNDHEKHINQLTLPKEVSKEITKVSVSNVKNFDMKELKR